MYDKKTDVSFSSFISDANDAILFHSVKAMNTMKCLIASNVPLDVILVSMIGI